MIDTPNQMIGDSINETPTNQLHSGFTPEEVKGIEFSSSRNHQFQKFIDQTSTRELEIRMIYEPKLI